MRIINRNQKGIKVWSFLLFYLFTFMCRRHSFPLDLLVLDVWCCI